MEKIKSFTELRDLMPDWAHPASGDQWARIIAFILEYQHKHPGTTPDRHRIATELGMNAQVVTGHLNSMENAGLIHVISRVPFRIMVSIDKVQEPVAAPATQPDLTTRGTQRQRAKSKVPRANGHAGLLRVAKQIAACIEAHRNQYGEPPTVQMMANVTGYAGTGSVTPILARMVDAGWIIHDAKRHQDYRLTENGREALLPAPVASAPATFSEAPSEAPSPPDGDVEALNEWAKQDAAMPPTLGPDRAPDPGPADGILAFPESLPRVAKVEDFDTRDLIMELTERGYMVRKA